MFYRQDEAAKGGKTPKFIRKLAAESGWKWVPSPYIIDFYPFIIENGNFIIDSLHSFFEHKKTAAVNCKHGCLSFYSPAPSTAFSFLIKKVSTIPMRERTEMTIKAMFAPYISG